MSQHTMTLFQYLEKEQITIDKSEFEFQMQSHPDYPSLLAISDTLNFFNINNGAIRLDFSDIELLPDRFVALLNDDDNPELFFIERKGKFYIYSNDKKRKPISLPELEKRWGRIVLLIEKSEKQEDIISKTNYFLWFLYVSLSLSLITLLAIIKIDFNTTFFLCLPAIGILFSIAALKELFGTKSELLNSFCNITVSTSCTSVVGSNKWKIFEIVNFSDLSMMFFGTQFIGLLAFILSGNSQSYFNIQQILLLSSVPVLIASLYYQKYIEKKWCPICLVIISIILFELGYLFINPSISFSLDLLSILLYVLVFLSVMVIWLGLKKLLTSQKELKDFQIKGTRFMRNYEIFKNTLLASEQLDFKPLSSGNIVVGNENASLKITIVTNPFCGHCQQAHDIIKKIIELHEDKIYVQFRFNHDSQSGNTDSENVHHKLVSIYYDNGATAFIKALHNWFDNKDETQLKVSEKSTITDLKIAEILKEQYLMNQSNVIAFTPAIFINQYQYPKMYDRKELLYFINDLLEDENFK